MSPPDTKQEVLELLPSPTIEPLAGPVQDPLPVVMEGGGQEKEKEKEKSRSSPKPKKANSRRSTKKKEKEVTSSSKNRFEARQSLPPSGSEERKVMSVENFLAADKTKDPNKDAKDDM